MENRKRMINMDKNGKLIDETDCKKTEKIFDTLDLIVACLVKTPNVEVKSLKIFLEQPSHFELTVRATLKEISNLIDNLQKEVSDCIIVTPEEEDMILSNKVGYLYFIQINFS